MSADASTLEYQIRTFGPDNGVDPDTLLAEARILAETDDLPYAVALDTLWTAAVAAAQSGMDPRNVIGGLLAIPTYEVHRHRFGLAAGKLRRSIVDAFRPERHPRT